MTGGPLLTTIIAIYFNNKRKGDSFEIINFSLFCTFPHRSSPKLLSLSSALLPLSVSVLNPNLNSFTHFLYQPFLAFQPFQSFTYSLLAKPLQIPRFRSPPVFYPHLLTEIICPSHTFRSFIFCLGQDSSPSEIKTYIIDMKVGIEGIDLAAVTGKEQIYNMYVYYMPYALFPQMIYLVL